MSWMRRSASGFGEDVPAVQLYVLYSLNCSCGSESVVTFWAKPPAVTASAIVKVHSVRIIKGSSGAHHACKMGSKGVRGRCRSRWRDSGDSPHAVSRCQRSEPRLDAFMRLPQNQHAPNYVPGCRNWET